MFEIISLHYTYFKYGSFSIGISVVWWWEKECLPQCAYITHKLGSSMKGRYKYGEGKINFLSTQALAVFEYHD